MLFGVGASPRGDRPFIDLMDVERDVGDTVARTRIWRCPAGPIDGGCNNDGNARLVGCCAVDWLLPVCPYAVAVNWTNDGRGKRGG